MKKILLTNRKPRTEGYVLMMPCYSYYHEIDGVVITLVNPSKKDVYVRVVGDGNI